MTSDYLLQKTEKSFCPKCGKPLHAMMKKNLSRGSAFYICFECKFVAQVGKGPLELTRE